MKFFMEDLGRRAPFQWGDKNVLKIFYVSNFAALPVVFKQPLQNKEAEEGGTAALCCELSKPNFPVEWRKGGLGLRPSDKYEMKQRGCSVELLIHNLRLEDTGEYSCDTGDQETKASLNVKGR